VNSENGSVESTASLAGLTLVAPDSLTAIENVFLFDGRSTEAVKVALTAGQATATLQKQLSSLRAWSELANLKSGAPRLQHVMQNAIRTTRCAMECLTIKWLRRWERRL